MQELLNDTVRRGLALAAELPDLTVDRVDDRLQGIYDDIQQSLRVPIVNQIFRTLANYPDFLNEAWRAVKPVVRTVVFEQAADDLRQQALLASTSEGARLDISGMAAADQLIDFNDTIHYVLPKLLLITTAFEIGAFGNQTAGSDFSLNEVSDLPRGIADGTTSVELIDPRVVDATLQPLFVEIRQVHDHPLLSSYFRGAAQWPNFLAKAWRGLVGDVKSEAYAARRVQLFAAAQKIVNGWPIGRIDVPPDQAADIEAILAGFRMKFIPEMMLDLGLIKARTEGKSAAGSSRFSVGDARQSV